MSIPVAKAEHVGLAAFPEKGTNPILQVKGLVNRYFYFCMSLLFAALVMWGFSRTVNDNLFHAAVPRPLLLWIHGAAFSGWVVFFMAQSTLVRIRKVSWHRLFGWFGAGLATVMVPLGVAIAIIMARFDTIQLHQIGAVAFLAIPFFDMIVFGMSVALAVDWRTRPEFHRRLLFIGTCALMDAPLGRFDFLFDHNLFYVCLDLLIALGVGRDLVVDGRIHKVYRYALPGLSLARPLRYTCGELILAGGARSPTESWHRACQTAGIWVTTQAPVNRIAAPIRLPALRSEDIDPHGRGAGCHPTAASIP